MMKVMQKKYIQIVVLIALVALFVIVNLELSKDGKGRYVGYSEHVMTVDCASLFDSSDSETYTLSFDISAEKEGDVKVYFYSNDITRYSYETIVHASIKKKHYIITVSPQLCNTDSEHAYLCFFGEYGTGVIPTISNIEIYAE